MIGTGWTQQSQALGSAAGPRISALLILSWVLLGKFQRLWNSISSSVKCDSLKYLPHQVAMEIKSWDPNKNLALYLAHANTQKMLDKNNNDDNLKNWPEHLSTCFPTTSPIWSFHLLHRSHPAFVSSTGLQWGKALICTIHCYIPWTWHMVLLPQMLVEWMKE